jgi:hypothetical protein
MLTPSAFALPPSHFVLRDRPQLRRDKFFSL